MIWGAIATGLSWVRAFPGPVLLTGLIGIAVGAVPTWLIARGVYTGTIANLRVELANLRADNASETARRMQVAAAEITENLEQLRAQSEAMLAELTAAGSRIIAAGRDLAARQKQLSEDERYACRREPLPADYLDRLRLPAE